MRGKKQYWKDTWQYQIILEILDDYWLSEKDEAMVVVHMAFIKEDGKTQTKQIKWTNRNTKRKLPILEGLFKKVPDKYIKPGELCAVPFSEDIDSWETWDVFDEE